MKSFTKTCLDQWLQAAKQITHAMALNVVVQEIREEYNLAAGRGV